jgi:NADH-quinone oxidoreductase subunit M
VAFALICLGLSLRVPVWPLHGWFTHVADEAPAAVFVAISGVTVPVGLYLFVRLGYALFPEMLANCSPWVVGVGAVNLVIGALCACAQRDLRRLLAFVCLSEVGLMLVGLGSLDPAGVVGAVFQQLMLGMALAGFGLFAGLVIERMGHAGFGEPDTQLGGLSLRAPFVAVVAGVIVASLLGLPGSGGFVGRSLLVIGGYSVHPLAVVVTGAVGMLASYYLLTMYRRVFLGPATEATSAFRDLSWREKAYLLPIVAGLVVFGIYPKPLLEMVRPSVLTLLSTVKP